MSPDRARLLIVEGDGAWDVGQATRLAAAPQDPGSGSVLVTEAAPRDTLIAPQPGGSWRLRPELFWSLLDPLCPRSAEPGSGNPLRRVWQHLAWWQELPRAERQACRSLVDRARSGAGAILDTFDRLAAAGSPFGTAPVASPPPPPAAAPPIPTDPAALAGFLLAADGLGSRYGRSFTPRQEQADLATAVARALIEGRALLAEAGTGTGKTLAYLAPLVARLNAGHERAVISTYSRALQTQILAGDLPLLTADRQGWQARLLMGRRNYLCLRQRKAYLTRPAEEPVELLRTAAFRLWLLATSEGMRDELVDHPLLAPDLSALFDGSQPCTPDCYEHDDCYVTRARRLARDARLVVVNHALLLSDLHAGGTLIGPYQDLVVDEAHRLPPTMLDAATVRLDHRRLVDLEELLGKTRPAGQLPETLALLAVKLREHPGAAPVGSVAEDLGRHANRCLRAYAHWWREVGRQLLAHGEPVPGQRQRIADKDLAFRPLNDATEELLAAAAAAATASGALNQGTETLEDLASGTMDLLLKAAAAGQLLRQLERDVRFVTADPSDRWVTWLEPARRGGIQALGATPLEAGPLLRDLWLEGQRAPVATSATLAVDGDFGFMLGELGLTGRRPPTATLSVPSPFAWNEQALCLAAEDLPDPDQAEFAGTIAAVLADLRRTVPRQTLALFTSYRLLQAVADQLMALEVQDDLFAGSRGEILVQSPRTSPADLRHRFRNARAAMLLGTSTFWEGVDFPGDSLEILVVTKLPFLVPSDPWVAARCEHLKAAGENPFTAFMVRDAVLRLRQGIGRLIRRGSDRGVVLLLDNRLISRHYGATFLSCLPVPVRWLPETGQLATATAEFLDRP